MEIIIQPTAEAATAVASRLVESLLLRRPAAVLGLATGSTPLLLYRDLVRKKLDWSKITTFNLDEYVGLGPNHPASYHQFMWQNFLRYLNIQRKNVHIPDGMTRDIPKFCDRYEKQIRAAGGIDLQVLGIGTNGHIGFNEPTSCLASRTRIKTLTPQPLRDNARFFSSGEEVPRHVITMGIGTVPDSRHCLMLAFGANKAHAIAAAVEGPVTSLLPASALQLHPKATVVLDEGAASGLKMADYYHWVYDNRPSWQSLQPA
jgi:glucosamine-6-phosphate deaminase